MLFNSIHFLLFFPAVCLLYFVFPHKIRWVWLLVASYYFYMSWNPQYALLIAFSTVVTYASGLLIEKANQKEAKTAIKLKKLWVLLSFAINLAILFFFKYFPFALSNINAVLAQVGITAIVPSFDVLLPVGISFYTFQALSYTMDVYRKEMSAEKNLLKYALFVSFFPQLVAGPIERSKNLLHQVHEKHTFDFLRMRDGLLLMLWGFFQKMVIADRVAILVNTVIGEYQFYEGIELVVTMLLFAVQIYCDFSGYSDIAIGAAQVMGFKLMDNFKQPYFATSIRDFWHRWHISLSTWFRDYLYIPLGGSRKGKWRARLNVLITFLASGLWHGAAWSFVIWGALHGMFQIVGEMIRKPKDRLYKSLRIPTSSFSFKLGQGLCTFLLVDFAWIFFRAPGAMAAFSIIRSIFSTFNPWILFDGSLYTMGLSRLEFSIMLLSIAILLFVNILQRKYNVRNLLSRQIILFRWPVYFAGIFAVVVLGIYGPGYAAANFLYFQF